MDLEIASRGVAKWLRLTKWDELQHYQPGSRKMLWAKLYSRRMQNYDLMNLHASTRELSTCLICIAIETDNLIPNDVNWLKKRAFLNAQQVKNGIEELLRIGFVEPTRRYHPASKMGQNACLEAEAEAEIGKGSSVVRLRTAVEETEKDSKALCSEARQARRKHEEIQATLPSAKERHVEWLLSWIGDDADGRTPAVVRARAAALSEGALAKIRESAQSKNGEIENRAAYVVGALQSERKERV